MRLQHISIGDRVVLLGLPDWLIHDLPKDEQAQMRSCVGQVAQVQEVDYYGYVWIGFAEMHSNLDMDKYSGHSFGVPVEFVRVVCA